MAGTAIEIQLVRVGDYVVPDAAVRELAEAGLVAGTTGPEVVFFDRYDPELLLSFTGGAGLGVTFDQGTQREAIGPLLRAGALDVLDATTSGWTLRIRALFEHHAAIDELMALPMVRANIEGQSRRWRGTLRRAVELSQGDASVLLTGETGTGKELLARLIHGLDPRPHKAKLMVLDCTTLVSELSGSELFGHERGAFTGAQNMREGIVAQAEGGTLFLDEVGELPLALQGQLLRVIQERTYRRVGSDSWRSSSFRLVCATHRNLEEEVKHGRFRADLYYRIAGSTVRLPPLRERRGDVLPLARFFLNELSDGRITGLEPLMEEHLLRREFPGNVRELRQLMARSYHRWVGAGPLGYAALPEEEWGVSGPDLESELEPILHKAVVTRIGLKEIGRAARELAVRIAVEEAAGNLQVAAAQLGVTDRALQMRRAQKVDA